MSSRPNVAIRADELDDLHEALEGAEADAAKFYRKLKAAESEADSLRQQLAAACQRANLLTIRVQKQHRLLKYWHQRFRWCASYSGRLQMERERQRERED